MGGFGGVFLFVCFCNVSTLNWDQVGMCETIRAHSDQRPDLILPFQQNTKNCLWL